MKRSDHSFLERILMPFALIYASIGLGVPWLYSRGPIKLFATFMAIWVFWGVMAVGFDPVSGAGEPIFCIIKSLLH